MTKDFKKLVEEFERGDKIELFWKIKVAVLGTYTANNVHNPLKLEFYKSKFNPEIRYGGYNQFIQEMSDANSWLHDFNPDIIFIALSAKSYLNDIEYRLLDMEKQGIDDFVNDKFGFIEHAIKNSSLKSKIIISNLEHTAYSPYGLMDYTSQMGIRCLISDFNGKLINLANQMNNVVVLDFDKISSNIGKKWFFDNKMYYLGKILLTNEGAEQLSKEIVNITNAIYGNIKKCLVVDLDNTLWGGIVGEEGPNGIKIGGDTTIGSIYSEIQKIILNYKKLGILLCIASKNNPLDVKEVFEKNQSMILKESDFIIKKINWEPKSKNIQEIAKELNVGLDSLVFLDDNPAERMEVGTALPMVEVLDFPEDVSKLPQILKEIPFFNSLKLTAEDRKRNEMYKQEIERTQLKKESNIEDYLSKIGTKIKIRKNDLSSLDRITQLINKTNQFNLRTQRYTDEQVKQMMESQDYDVFSLNVSDKFGELGLTGVIILKNEGGLTFIDSFLLSCRILSRKIENQFFVEVMKTLSSPKGRMLEAEYIPTQKNAQVRDFYESIGLRLASENEGKKRYKTYLNDLNLGNIDWITVENE